MISILREIQIVSLIFLCSLSTCFNLPGFWGNIPHFTVYIVIHITFIFSSFYSLPLLNYLKYASILTQYLFLSILAYCPCLAKECEFFFVKIL